MITRPIATALAVVLLVTPLSSIAQAQQAPPPSAEEIRFERRARRTDGYDVGAGIMTVFRVPGTAILCGLGTIAGAVLFLGTFGSAARPSANLIAEGCGGPWVVRGDDIRPDDRTGGWRLPGGSDGQ